MPVVLNIILDGRLPMGGGMLSISLKYTETFNIVRDYGLPPGT